jgi:ubiquinone/menaquinone biosynthesis C-methylase UbiE
VEDKVPAPVGLAEDAYFELDESVTFWKNFQRSTPPSAVDNIREASSIMTSIAAEGAEGQQYALAHGVLRTGYFATNAVLGTLAFELSKRVGGEQPPSGAEGQEAGLLARGLDPAVELLTRLVLESALSFQQDFRQISKGYYKAPWDMTTPGHRQLTPQYAAQKTLSFMNEAIRTLGSRMREKVPGIWLDSPFYPDYYKNDFHYQTDGWMSPRSAQVYETSTETLFLGRQDAMQRISLVPLHSMAGANGGTPRILEVACGTGRFATFIRDSHPTADVTLVDLSPFYLEAARENDEYWRETKFPNKETRPAPATFVQAAAESLPFAEGSFDAVVCVYLFHEMPEAARAAAAQEMARVVAPGGMVVLTDSAQRGDRASITTEGAKAFGKLNEPHYEKYIDTYIPSLFTDSGLTCDRKLVESSTKCLSFRKP